MHFDTRIPYVSNIFSTNLTLGFCRFWHNSQRWQADMHRKCKQWVFLLQGFLCNTPKNTSSDGSDWTWAIYSFVQIDELLKQRNEIHASYTVAPLKRSSSKSRNKTSLKETKEDGQAREKRSTRDRPKKKKWYNLHIRVDKRKAC